MPAPWIPSRSPVVHRPPVGTHRCRWAGGPHRWIKVGHIGGQEKRTKGRAKPTSPLRVRTSVKLESTMETCTAYYNYTFRLIDYDYISVVGNR